MKIGGVGIDVESQLLGLAAADTLLQGFMEEPAVQWARGEAYSRARLVPAERGRQQHRMPHLALMGLACVGLYGMMSFHVARRTREIGIRLTLGEPPRSALAGILRSTTIVSPLGIAVGIGCALVATDIVSAFLYRLSARDPLTLVGDSIALYATALTAGYLPARRAARIDPLSAIRAE